MIASKSQCSTITGANFMEIFKKHLKHFLLKLQIYGNDNEWIECNRDLGKYLGAIKHDPYCS